MKRMDISIIIPVHNKPDQLEKTLYFISGQKDLGGIGMEVVIVDDGSTEPVREVVDSYRDKLPSLNYIFIPRDKHSCRSRARNTGIAESKGRILVFLDCGIVIPDTMIRQSVGRIGDSANMVLYHYILGAFTDPDVEDMSVIEGITPQNLADTCERLKFHPGWEDMRTAHFELVGGDLNRMDVPWTMGWSGAVSASREIVVKSGGFDESFKGWGAEDTDFSYHLHLHGAAMYATEEICVLHLPHAADDKIDMKIKTSFMNRKKMHFKHYTFDTELYPYSADMHYDGIMSKFNRLVIKYYTPLYPAELIGRLHDDYLAGAERSAIVGADSYALLKELDVSHIFLQNKHIYQDFKSKLTDKEVVYMLGADTPYASGYFDVLVVTDFYRMISEPIAGIWLKELQRISKKLVFIHNETYVSYLATVAGWTWHSLDELQAILGQKQLAYSVSAQIGEFLLLDIAKAAPAANIAAPEKEPALKG
ncbi:glycosyltransferase [Paenibacillus pinisoli]|uniref:Glycosyltransferase n=1 Tax=Paenibacillus pinisoli TaxID=1276110 RepID=A0A3A6PAD4_9BACL|nr:glycosyltransferase family 2 protein [Paenibacillus pinisoli]RJX38052.1 glycosyltransferase [Paenibacillus pinisoli]